MIIISYDISSDKKRTKFNKYICKFGHRLQYSVYEIENSERILNNIVTDLNNKWLKQFDQTNKLMKQLTGGGNSRMMRKLLGKKGKMPF